MAVFVNSFRDKDAVTNQRQLRTAPGDQLLAWVSGISCSVVAVASLAEFVTFGSLFYLTVSQAIIFSAITAFGLFAWRLRRSWALIAAAAGTIGFSIVLFDNFEGPLPFAISHRQRSVEGPPALSRDPHVSR